MVSFSYSSETIPDFEGLVIDDRFQILEKLGSGTYGVVYKAIDLELDTDVNQVFRAIKIINKVGRGVPELENVRQEVALHSVVSKHPNIVTVHDAFEDESYFFIVLDLCRGGDLFGQICERGAYLYNDELLRKAFLSLIDGVQACHGARIFHRDLKPENILTSKDGSEVYLTDFGLATDQSIVTEHGCGTTIYMSPECVGEMTNYRSYCTRGNDVWALGVILINMVGGRQPWNKASSGDVSFVRFLEEPNHLKDTWPISDELDAILQRIFLLNPLERITLQDLRKAIVEVDTFFVPRQSDEDEYAEVATASVRRYTTGNKLSLVKEEYDITEAHFDKYDYDDEDDEDDDDTPVSSRQPTKIGATLLDDAPRKVDINNLMIEATNAADVEENDIGTALWEKLGPRRIITS